MKFRQIEFWTASGTFAIAIYFILQDSLEKMPNKGPNSYLDSMERTFREKGLVYDHLVNGLFPQLAIATILYGSFIFLNNYVIPRWYPQQNYRRIGLMTLLAFLSCLTVFAIAFYLQHMYMEDRLFPYFIEYAPPVVLGFGIYLFYAFLKKVLERYLTDPDNKHPLIKTLLRQSLLALCIWALVLPLFIMTNTPFLIITWLLLVPGAFLLYMLNLYWLIPWQQKKKRKFWVYLAAVLPLVIFLQTVLIALCISTLSPSNEAPVTLLGIFAPVFALGISWLVYRKNEEQLVELLQLRRELGRTTTDLRFLRSQINPHFLFNALNTLYGTSLQEKAERTGEGIQKLGDMMRFMLHENQQDKIGLAREIDYLKDYLHLQKLRLEESDQISVEVNIDEEHCQHSIAPMLLIPFVENAFKHGISLQKRSWVNIALRCDKNSLHFDIYNSIHRKNRDDPERENPGIGLENVRQRLHLLYPGKHELVIRENVNEYFVHLTIRLL